jgi:hypothetical protein
MTEQFSKLTAPFMPITPSLVSKPQSLKKDEVKISSALQSKQHAQNSSSSKFKAIDPQFQVNSAPESKSTP